MCMSAQQNLVPNGSFEDYTVCPDNAGQVNNAKHWFDPTYTSSDYYNACCSNNIAGVPNNFYGSKSAYDGNGMMGFAMFSGIFYPNSREYIAVKLLDKLDSNVNYCFSCYISPSGDWKYACNGFGIYLTDDTSGIYNYSFNTINYSPDFIDTTVFSNINEWKKIEMNFLNKKKNAIYLIIGNFYNDAEISNTILDSSALDISYYYVDKVRLTDCKEISLQIPNVLSANNDGINDVFIINGLSINSSLSIYNRWGNRIYMSENYNNDWKPTELIAGTYYYILKTETENYKGFLEIFK